MLIHSLFKQLKRDKLTQTEKEQMHTAIKEAQRQFPAHVVTPNTSWAFLRITPAFRFSMVALSLIIVVGAGGGTALAAESALPGDILYPVKINLNEKIRASLAIDVESKAKLEERLAERRLDELEKLVEQGRLTAEHEIKITTQFNDHKANMERNIVRLEATGKINQAANLRARLITFTEKKEDKILRTLNVQLKKETERENRENKTEEIKPQEKLERRAPIESNTKAKVRADVENKLIIKIEKKREERRVEQGQKKTEKQIERESESEKSEVKEKSLVAPRILNKTSR